MKWPQIFPCTKTKRNPQSLRLFFIGEVNNRKGNYTPSLYQISGLKKFRTLRSEGPQLKDSPGKYIAIPHFQNNQRTMD
jgi:hypothetical protein